MNTLKSLTFSIVFLVTMFALTGHYMGVDILGGIARLLGIM